MSRSTSSLDEESSPSDDAELSSDKFAFDLDLKNNYGQIFKNESVPSNNNDKQINSSNIRFNNNEIDSINKNNNESLANCPDNYGQPISQQSSIIFETKSSPNLSVIENNNNNQNLCHENQLITVPSLLSLQSNLSFTSLPANSSQNNFDRNTLQNQNQENENENSQFLQSEQIQNFDYLLPNPSSRNVKQNNNAPKNSSSKYAKRSKVSKPTTRNSRHCSVNLFYGESLPELNVDNFGFQRESDSLLFNKNLSGFGEMNYFFFSE